MGARPDQARGPPLGVPLEEPRNCANLIREAAARAGLEVPVYEQQGTLVRARAERKARRVTLAVAAGSVAAEPTTSTNTNRLLVSTSTKACSTCLRPSWATAAEAPPR